jgi:hypothetical protein
LYKYKDRKSKNQRQLIITGSTIRRKNVSVPSPFRKRARVRLSKCLKLHLCSYLSGKRACSLTKENYSCGIIVKKEIPIISSKAILLK